MAESDLIEYKVPKRFPQYSVGSDGSVWSKRRSKQWVRIGSQVFTKSGVRVVLYDASNAVRRMLIHNLVLETFKGPPPCPLGERRLWKCEHRDGDVANNALANLRWVKKKGLPKANNRGERHGRSVLSEKKVRQIRKLLAVGKSVAYVTRELKLKERTVRDVKDKRTWGWLED